MNKFLNLALTLVLLAPFFSSAESIFNESNSIPATTSSCEKYIWQTDFESCGFDQNTALTIYLENFGGGEVNDCTIQSLKLYSGDDPKNGGRVDIVCMETVLDYFNNPVQTMGPVHGITFSYDGPVAENTCSVLNSYNPPDTTFCVNPNEIASFDSCDFNDVYTNPVSEPNVCITKSDGSICAASSVDIGGGQSAYMPTENNCYSDVYPVLDENGGVGNLPDGSDQQCTESGALKYCPANPEEVCPNGQCDAGCGQMNGQFICVSPIESPDGGDGSGGDGSGGDGSGGDGSGGDGSGGDGSGGDGSGGDGSGGGGSGGDGSGGGGSGTEPCTGDGCDIGSGTEPCTGDNCIPDGFCDQEGNCSTNIATRTEPSDGLKGFWKTDYPDGLVGIMEGKILDAQGTAFYGFIESFNPSLGSGAAPPMQLCFNMGSMANFGCHSLLIDPRVYPAIRIFILITAGFLCRKILFGG